MRVSNVPVYRSGRSAVQNWRRLSTNVSTRVTCNREISTSVLSVGEKINAPQLLSWFAARRLLRHRSDTVRTNVNFNENFWHSSMRQNIFFVFRKTSKRCRKDWFCIISNPKNNRATNYLSSVYCFRIKMICWFFWARMTFFRILWKFWEFNLSINKIAQFSNITANSKKNWLTGDSSRNHFFFHQFDNDILEWYWKVFDDNDISVLLLCKINTVSTLCVLDIFFRFFIRTVRVFGILSETHVSPDCAAPTSLIHQ